MNQNMKLGITIGVIAGLLTFLFGGWSVAMFGLFAGTGLGLALANRFDRKEPGKLAVEALPTAAVSAAVMLVLSLLQVFVVQPATGKSPFDLNTILGANISG